MPTIQDLAKLVLEWAETDDIVKEHGWDGGKHEAAWEDLKERMVKMSSEILGRNLP